MPEDDFDLDQTNLDRREARVQRENLIREYTSREENLSRSLEENGRELAELENKVRYLAATIDKEEEDITAVSEKLLRLKRNSKRDKFELRQNRTRILELQKQKGVLEDDIAATRRRLKKAKIEGK